MVAGRLYVKPRKGRSEEVPVVAGARGSLLPQNPQYLPHNMGSC